MRQLVRWRFRPDLLTSSAGLRNALNHLRWISALAVCSSHLRTITFPDARFIDHPNALEKIFYFFTLFATQSVVVFFVVSGLLVGGSVVRLFREDRFDGMDYTRDRLSRLYIVLIPALILTAAVGYWGGSECGRDSLNGVDYLGSLFFVQNGITSPPCNNHALWSLASEATYYAAAPIVMLVLAGQRRLFWLACLAVLVVLSLPSFINGPQSIPFGATLWICGLIPWFVRIELPAGLTLLPLLAALSIGRMHLVPSEYLQDWLIALTAAVFLASRFSQSARFPILAKLGAGMAAFSYSLYLVHMPIAQAFARRLNPAILTQPTAHVGVLSIELFAAAMVVTLAVSWLFGVAFEGNTGKLRRLLGGRSHSLRPPVGASTTP